MNEFEPKIDPILDGITKLVQVLFQIPPQEEIKQEPVMPPIESQPPVEDNPEPVAEKLQ